MRLVKGDLWSYPADIRVITTNGTLRQDGTAVMGRGCAQEAATRFVMLPRQLGILLKKYGNHVVSFPEYHLITFPTKHHWSEDSDVKLIEQSVSELKQFIRPRLRIVMPRAGCGHGRLQWDDVKPILAKLPDNVMVISNSSVGD